jgi:hypothetical protein
MIDDRDVFTAAKLLIDQHGNDAGIVAAQRADGIRATWTVPWSGAGSSPVLTSCSAIEGMESR